MKMLLGLALLGVVGCGNDGKGECPPQCRRQAVTRWETMNGFIWADRTVCDVPCFDTAQREARTEVRP